MGKFAHVPELARLAGILGPVTEARSGMTVPGVFKIITRRHAPISYQHSNFILNRDCGAAKTGQQVNYYNSNDNK
jgi:hypothetical protein